MRIIYLFIAVFLFIEPTVLFAAMSSTNYQILGDTVDSGGRATSTNYAQFSAIGEFGGTQSSSNYTSRGGFLNIEKDASVSLSLTSSALSLGTLSVSSVATASTSAVVSSDSSSGYQLFISESGNFSSGSHAIMDVSDGSVSTGSEEYGVRTAGSAGLYNSSDTSITSSWKSIGSNGSAATSESTTVTIRAGIDSSTPEGTYSQTLNFAVTAQF